VKAIVADTINAATMIAFGVSILEALILARAAGL
jgi:hypothetical protein